MFYELETREKRVHAVEKFIKVAIEGTGRENEKIHVEPSVRLL